MPIPGLRLVPSLLTLPASTSAIMTIVHMGQFMLPFTMNPSSKQLTNIMARRAVCFKFRPEVTQEHKDTFVQELKKLKDLPCVKDSRLIVGGPSITDPIERSKGFQYALLSFHEDKKALEEYQASKEHHW